MQDRFKFRYVFTKDFGGKTGICYKMPIFKLDTITDENFNKIVKSYIDYDYKLISIEQSTGLKDKNGELIYEGNIVKAITRNPYEEYIGVIQYHTCYFSLDYKEVGKYGECGISLSKNTSDFATLEILGNRYENPELLKNKK